MTARILDAVTAAVIFAVADTVMLYASSRQVSGELLAFDLLGTAIVVATVAGVASVSWALVRRDAEDRWIAGGVALLLTAVARARIARLSLVHPKALVAIALAIVLAAALRVVARRLSSGAPAVHRWAWLSIATLALAFVDEAYWVLPVFSRPHGALPTSSENAQPAPPANAPNVLLVVLDTVRADHLEPYGYQRPTTPHLATLARGATVFRDAVANSNWSLPSHASLFTGLLPSRHGAHTVVSDVREGRAVMAHHPLGEEAETLAERLGAAGYRTGLVSANHAWLSAAWGLQQGFQHVEDEPKNLLSTEPLFAPFLRRTGWRSLIERYALASNNYRSADDVVERATRWIDSGSRPFFLFLNFMDAHSPYSSAYLARRMPAIRARFGDADARGIDKYDLAIAYLDACLDRLFRHLRSRGLFDATLVILTADHGETFAEGGERGLHGTDLRQSTLGIPLIVRQPHQTRGELSDAPVQLVDIMPTVLEAAGLPAARDLAGESLERVARGEISGRPRIAENYFSALFWIPLSDAIVDLAETPRRFPTSWALLESGWKLVWSSDGSRQLFDLASDPGERSDRSTAEPERTQRMEERLFSLLPQDLRQSYLAPKGESPLDPETLERMRALGYVH